MKQTGTEITAPVNGRRVTGRFSCSAGILTVSYGGQERTTQLGNFTPELLAKILLTEMAALIDG